MEESVDCWVSQCSKTVPAHGDAGGAPVSVVEVVADSVDSAKDVPGLRGVTGRGGVTTAMAAVESLMAEHA